MGIRTVTWSPLLPCRISPRHLRLVIFLTALWLFVGVVLLSSPRSVRTRSPFANRESRLVVKPLSERVSCYGPRGKLLSNSPDDELQFGHLSNTSYPVPFIGSHRELGVAQTWVTADGRYGPYGFAEDTDQNNRSRVDWDNVNWGRLQNDCFERNSFRFSNSTGKVTTEARLTWRNETKLIPTPDPLSFNATRRTALLIRAWANFAYKPEDLWNIRSLIVEAALRTGGEYQVVLLVHIQDREKNIFKSKDDYDAAFEAADIPPELQSIAILWDENLLESWYDKIQEHGTFFQVNQPAQLFALHYPEFDHYWQIEMDQRFLGDAGQYLDATSRFARNEPRKQALERSTFAFHDDIYGTYREMMSRVDAANEGRSRAWGPMTIPDLDPIGPRPPVQLDSDEAFAWGVGEDADVVVTSFCADVVQTTWWVFHDWIHGFKKGKDTPRWFCPPAIMRASRRLLLAIHQAQHDGGLSVPGEATLPSFALWHGLKLSYPPQPAYMRPHEPHLFDWRDDWTRDPTGWLNSTVTPWFGNTTDASPDGLSHGNPQSWADMGMSYWWMSDYPRRIFDMWLSGNALGRREEEEEEEDHVPGVLAVQGGKVYAPNMVMHPVKSS